MVDFKSLVGSKREIATYDLEKLYSSLDVKGTHTELRQVQREALAELTARRTDRDVVLKISTGAGKTTVGLLYLLGHMRQQRGVGVFLCPTVQLVEQVIQEATKLGIQAFHYARGEKYPDPACVRGEAILVCTYEKLFNAKTTFLRSDVSINPVALVLDDAHAGVETVRKQFTLKVTGDAFEELKRLLSARCRSYHPTRWQEVEQEDPLALLEVPHWIWGDLAADLRANLHRYAEDNSFQFSWRFLESVLPLCRCVVSGSRAEIAPEVLPVNQLRPFESAGHRLFMSATLADDSLLVRELGAEQRAAEVPIAPPSDRGLGERMILAPALVSPDLDRAFVMRACSQFARTTNVVVLTSSEQLAKDWVSAGAAYFAGEHFSEGVRQLRDPGSGLRFAVFAQRYDGVDLPDDSCRVLVLDGVPFGESLIDKADSMLAFAPGGVRNRTVFRIEQGMGRAVRSHADYAVVLLAGQDLATYIGRTEVLQQMTSDARAQIDLSVELADIVKRSKAEDPGAAVQQVIAQSLARDEGWKAFYNERIRSAPRRTVEVRHDRIQLAAEERECHLLAVDNRAPDAVPRLRKALNAAKLQGDELGIYLQRLSRITYLFDPVEALKIQQGAREHCGSVALPPTAPRRPSAPGAKSVAERVCAWFRGFAAGNAAVLEAARILASLDFEQRYRDLEAAIMALGEALGAESSRPEMDFDDGPDNLWFWGGTMFVIEVKNEKRDSLHKSDSGQLHNSVKWAKEAFPEFEERLVPVTVARVSRVDGDAHYPAGSRVLLEDGAKQLGRGLHSLCIRLAQEGPVFVTPENVLARMTELQLLPEQFAGRHTIAL